MLLLPMIFAFFRDPNPKEEDGLGDLFLSEASVMPSNFLSLGDLMVSARSFGRHGTLRMKNPQVISAHAQKSNGPMKYI